jgi:hypothetical protein
MGKNGKPLRALTPAGVSEHLPIEEKFGPSVAKLVDIPAMLQKIKFDSVAYMQKQAQSQLNRFAKRLPTDSSGSSDE